jgi:hypothetical protein
MRRIHDSVRGRKYQATKTTEGESGEPRCGSLCRAQTARPMSARGSASGFNQPKPRALKGAV